VLYVIDPFDFQTAVNVGKAQVAQLAADLGVKNAQSARRQRLSDLATTGADFVSVGSLTHSVIAADISFEIAPL